MNPWARAAVQGATCGLMIGLVVLVGGRLWWPQVAAAQAGRPGVADVVRARRFEVVDAAGKPWALLASHPLAAMGLDGSPSLQLYDAAGKVRAGLILVPDGNPSLALFDAAGEGGAQLYVSRDGISGLSLRDAAGEQRAILLLTKGGDPYLKLADKAGTSRAVLGVTSLERVKTAEVTMRPESSLVLFDKDGKVLWQAP